MPSADFCLITYQVTLIRAIGFHLFRSFQLMRLKSQGSYKPVPDWLSYRSLVKQFSPLFIDKNRTCIFFSLLHHLRWPLDHVVLLSCANSPLLAYASYDVLVHQLAKLLAASSGPILTDKPLPFASS